MDVGYISSYHKDGTISAPFPIKSNVDITIGR